MKRYQNFSDKGKDKRQKKTQERYQNFTEDENEKKRQFYQEPKKKLPDYRRIYFDKLKAKFSVFWRRK